MLQKTENVLRVSFSCDTLNLPIGTPVRISDDLEIAEITRVADPNYLGRIIANYHNDSTYTVTTAYTNRYDKAVAGVANLAVGPGLHGPDNKIFPFEAPAPAYHAGSAAGPYTFVLNTTDVLSITVNSESAQPFQLETGTLQDVCDLVNATAADFVLSATADGKLAISGLNVDDAFTINAPANHCNAVLGITAAVYSATAGSKGSPTCMIINGGTAAGDLIEILEY
jgi:hypothetical protein